MSAGLGCESRLVWLPVDAGRIFWSCVSYLWNSFERATKWFRGCNRCIRAKDSWVQTPTSMRSLHVNPALLDLWKFQSLKKKHATSTLRIQVQGSLVKDIPDYISWKCFKKKKVCVLMMGTVFLAESGENWILSKRMFKFLCAILGIKVEKLVESYHETDFDIWVNLSQVISCS